MRNIFRNTLQLLKDTKSSVYILLVIYFLQGIIHNLGHPVTPQLVNDLQITKQYFGFYFAAMSLGLMLGAPLWGALGDRGSKRFYIILGLIIYSIGQFAFAYVGDKNMMILFRFLSGFGVSASITLLMSYFLEHADEKYRMVYLGWYQGLLVLGASLGYLIGGMLPEIQWFVTHFHTDDLRVIFLLQAVLNLGHATYIFFLVRPSENPLVLPQRSAFKRAFLDLFDLNKNLILFLFSLTFISLGAINVSKFIEVFMNDNGYSTRDIGTFVWFTGIVSLGATIFIVPLISLLKKDFVLMILIQTLSAFIIFFVFRSNELLVTLYTFFMLYVVLKTVYTPLEQHFIASYAKRGEYGQIMGVRQLFFSLGMVIGPFIGGFLYDAKPLYVFDFSVLMFLVGVILLFFVGRNIKKTAVMSE